MQMRLVLFDLLPEFFNPLQGAIPRSLLRSRSEPFPSDTS
jgi:hypothetical protein